MEQIPVMNNVVPWRDLATAFILIVWVMGLIALGLLDLFLIEEKVPSISQRVTGGNNILGLLVLAYFMIGPSFIVLHFWFGLFAPEV